MATAGRDGGSRWLADARRILNRAKREAIARFGPARQYLEHQHEKRARRYAPQLRPLDAVGTETVEQLEVDGISHPSFDDLAGEQADAVREGLSRLTASLAAQSVDGRSTIRPSDDELMSEVAVWQLGLSPELLDIAEHYLGVPAWYYGADVRREVADGKVLDVRQWHRDKEDRRVLKILVWLSDVGDADGPFAYMEPAVSDKAAARLHYVSGFVTDERMRTIIPEEQWHTAPGPKWQINYVDTARMMHRATPPNANDRYSITFTWTSRHPVAFNEVPGADASNAHLALEGLDARQREALAPQWADIAGRAATVS